MTTKKTATPKPDLDEQYELTSAEAVAKIKAQPRGTIFYAHIRERAAVAGEPDRQFSHAFSAAVKLTRAAALKLAADLLSKPMEERGARIPSSLYQRGDYRAFYVV